MGLKTFWYGTLNLKEGILDTISRITKETDDDAWS